MSEQIPFIDLKSQYKALETDIKARINKVLEHGQYILGPEVYDLEEKLADYVGTKHCITASSGTDTLMMALMALGIESGDEVITTPFTFIATGEMIALLGAVPVFVDIDRQTYNIDATKIEEAITPRTKAIMPVSLYGQCADFDEINTIADRHGLPVIEDAAQSFGATYKNKKSCSLSTIGSTSFFPSKPLGAYGDGGALFTDDATLAKSLREIGSHGQEKRYRHGRIGINGRLDTIQAAVLLAKLTAFPEEIVARRRVADQYDSILSGSVETPYIQPENASVYAQYTVLVENRENLQEALKSVGVPTAVHYPVPLSLQPAFSFLNKAEGSYPVSEAIAKRVMSLPMSPYLTNNLVQKVSKALLEAI